MNIDNWTLLACAASAINGCVLGTAARFSLFPGKRRHRGEGSLPYRQRQPLSTWSAMAMTFGVIAALLMMPAWHHDQLDLGRMMASCFALTLLATAQPELLVRIAEAVSRGLARIP